MEKTLISSNDQKITDLTKQKIKKFTIDHIFQNIKKPKAKRFFLGSLLHYSTIDPLTIILQKTLVDFSYYVKQTWDP